MGRIKIKKQHMQNNGIYTKISRERCHIVNTDVIYRQTFQRHKSLPKHFLAADLDILALNLLKHALLNFI